MGPDDAGMDLIAVGDTVRLNSGGADMTVLGVMERSTGEVLVECMWFDMDDRGCTVVIRIECIYRVELVDDDETDGDEEVHPQKPVMN